VCAPTCAASRFSTVQITVKYGCTFVLLFGRYSLQLGNKGRIWNTSLTEITQTKTFLTLTEGAESWISERRFGSIRRGWGEGGWGVNKFYTVLIDLLRRMYFLFGDECLRPRPHYAKEICKRRFHSEKASNVFRLHYAGEFTEIAAISGHFGFIFA